MSQKTGPLEYARKIPPAEPPPRCQHDTDRCCPACAHIALLLIAAMPPRDPVAINNRHHAHTAAMRLRTIADRIDKDPAMAAEFVTPGLDGMVSNRLRELANVIDGMRLL